MTVQMPKLVHKIPVISCNVKFNVRAKRKKRHLRPEPKKRHPRPKPLGVSHCEDEKNSIAYSVWTYGRNSPNKMSFSPRVRKKTPAPGTPRPMHTKPPVSVLSFALQKNSIAHPGGGRWVAPRTNSIPFLLRKKHSAAYRCWLARKNTALFVATCVMNYRTDLFFFLSFFLSFVCVCVCLFLLRPL